jgi:hypothetical protein
MLHQSEHDPSPIRYARGHAQAMGRRKASQRSLSNIPNVMAPAPDRKDTVVRFPRRIAMPRRGLEHPIGDLRAGMRDPLAADLRRAKVRAITIRRG